MNKEMQSKHKEKILIVEDTADIRMILDQFFQMEGYEVSGAGNGVEALDLLRAGQRPDRGLCQWRESRYRPSGASAGLPRTRAGRGRRCASHRLSRTADRRRTYFVWCWRRRQFRHSVVEGHCVCLVTRQNRAKNVGLHPGCDLGTRCIAVVKSVERRIYAANFKKVVQVLDLA